MAAKSPDRSLITHDIFPTSSPTIRTSESVSKISGALVDFSEKGIEFVAESTNPHFRSAYATLPFVLHRVVRPLASVGISVIQGGTLLDGQFGVTTRLIHRSGEWIETVLPIQPSAKALDRDACQAYASAATYGRRVSLLAILALAPVDPKEEQLLEVDDDGNTASGKSEKKSAPSRPAKAVVKTAKPVADNIYVTVAECESTTGETRGKPWTRTAITFSDGRAVSTFDDRLADIAQHAADKELEVLAVTAPSKKNPQYTDLVALSLKDQDIEPPLTDDDAPF